MIMILIIVIPLYILIRSQKVTSKKFTEEAIAKGVELGLNFTKTEQWNQQFIGIDVPHHKLFHRCKTSNFQNKDSIVNLKEVLRCDKIIRYKTVQNTSSNNQLLQKVALLLKFSGNQRPDLELEFFNSDKSAISNYEEERAENWKNQINSLLTDRVRTI